MAQFDIYRNANAATSDSIPYLLNVQNDLLGDLKSRLVVPLAVGRRPIRHLNPVFRIENLDVVMAI